MNSVALQNCSLTQTLSQRARAIKNLSPFERRTEDEGSYKGITGFYKLVILDEIKTNDFVLTSGRYVGAAKIEDDGIPFETKMKELSQTFYGQMEQAEELDKLIRDNLEVLGYGR